MQATEAQRAELDAGAVAGRTDPQPRRRGALVGITPLAEQHADPAAESVRRERHDRAARRIQPLHVVDGHQHGCRLSQAVDHRRHGGCRYALVGDVAVAGGAQQHPVDREPLQVGQPVDDRRLDVAEQISDGCVGQHGLGLADLCGKHAEPTSAGLLKRVQPQRGLADAGLALDDQTCRARLGSGQEVDDCASFGRPAESAARHAQMIPARDPSRPPTGRYRNVPARCGVRTRSRGLRGRASRRPAHDRRPPRWSRG